MIRRASFSRPRAASPSRRLGRASAQRRKAGGRIAQGRESETVAGYRTLTARLIARSGGYCEVFGKPTFGTEVCHVVARSAGGSDDEWNTYWGSRAANRAQQAAFSSAGGRLLMDREIRQGVKGIAWELVRAADKWAYHRGQYEVLASGYIRAELA